MAQSLRSDLTAGDADLCGVDAICYRAEEGHIACTMDWSAQLLCCILDSPGALLLTAACAPCSKGLEVQTCSHGLLDGCCMPCKQLT